MLSPKGSPVPSVLNLSSTRAKAGLAEIAAALAAAINDPPMLTPPLGDGFSAEQLTRPLLPIAGNPTSNHTANYIPLKQNKFTVMKACLPRTGEEETPKAPLRMMPAPVTDEVRVAAEMVAIVLQ